MIQTFKILFRYRDLVAPTLEMHREVLNKKKMVWWGWWKRPQEDARFDVWQELADEIEEKGKVAVGLYDSGHDLVHMALVDSIKPPEKNELGEYVQVPLADAEKELVPEYYRHSPFSRAWMRIIHIKSTPEAFFGNYSFDEPPPLRGLSQSQLDTIRGKLILDGAELRGMDTTIWRIRPSRDEDKRERVLTLGSLSPRRPVDSTPMAARGSIILHITDPHYATGDSRHHHVWRLESERQEERHEPTLVEAINAALAPDIRSRIGLILVTGDLTVSANPDEFKEAHSSLVKLYGALGIGSEHLVVMPGNHDLSWTNEAVYDDKAEVGVAPREATANYRDFYKKLFQHEAHVSLCMGRRFVLPSGCVLDICALNSSSLEQGRDFLAGMGQIQQQSFEAVARELGWHGPSSLAFRLLAIHHHLVPTDNLESHTQYSKGFGMAVDSPRIQRLAAKRGVQLALHGHKHRFFIGHSSVYELPEENHEKYHLGEISIIGGGSAGSPETDGNKNFFNLIDFGSEHVTLTSYRSRQKSSFDKFLSWNAPILLKDGRLALGPWCRAG